MLETLRRILGFKKKEVDLDSLPFKEYLKVLESNDDEESRILAEEMSQLPRRLALFERNTTGRTPMLSEIENLPWKEIKFKISLATEDVLMQLESLDKMLERFEEQDAGNQLNKLGDGWNGVVLAK